nr:endonuclease [Lysobacter sp.]
EEILAVDPAARIAIVGDLNEPETAPAVALLARPPLLNLIEQVPDERRYTYNFEGGSEALDHLVVSAALAASAEVDIVHLNTDCAESRRISDHDAVVARFRLD